MLKELGKVVIAINEAKTWLESEVILKNDRTTTHTRIVEVINGMKKDTGMDGVFLRVHNQALQDLKQELDTLFGKQK